jgi:hypothetical protein
MGGLGMTPETEEMQLPQRASKFEWNLNTVIQVITLVMMAGGGVALWVNRSRDVDELQKWRIDAEQNQKDLTVRIGKVESLVDNLGYRVTAGEQSNASTTSSIKEVQSTLNQQSGDLKVVKEILQRIEASQKGRTQ